MEIPAEEIEFPEVAAGIAWLDHRVPGWASMINLKTLDLRSPADCVACQAAAIRHYSKACDRLGIRLYPFYLAEIPESLKLGFDYKNGSHSKGRIYWFKHAEAQWRRAIADRLARRDHAPTPKGAIP